MRFYCLPCVLRVTGSSVIHDYNFRSTTFAYLAANNARRSRAFVQLAIELMERLITARQASIMKIHISARLPVKLSSRLSSKACPSIVKETVSLAFFWSQRAKVLLPKHACVHILG
jgi:hypothetical protein